MQKPNNPWKDALCGCVGIIIVIGLMTAGINPVLSIAAGMVAGVVAMLIFSRE